MNKKQKKALAQIISAVVLLAVISLVTGKVSVSPYVEFVLYMVPYLLVGYESTMPRCRLHHHPP